MQNVSTSKIIESSIDKSYNTGKVLMQTVCSGIYIVYYACVTSPVPGQFGKGSGECKGSCYLFP